MNWIRQRVLSRDLMVGTWLNLGSSLTAEIAGRAGFDWVVIDVEHGAGDHESLVHQLQAISGTPAAPLVRIAWNEAPRFKRVLDLGGAGVVVPYVTTAEEARQAAAAMRYPPKGVRGVASMNRASGFGQEFDAYFAEANDGLLTVVQIETATGVDHAHEIAAVEGVDVLFVGPMDLSVNMGIPLQYQHPGFRSALARISDACRTAGKAAGILLGRAEQIKETIAAGFSFIGLGSDGAAVAEGMRRLAAAFRDYK
jgi:2-keto-3-deoxy-L-rhamnonate aldolase RhmA